MGRPSLDLGTAGTIRIYPTPGGYRAMTRYRDWDGHVRNVERHGSTKGAASQALKRALRDRLAVDGGAEVTPEMRLAEVAEIWFAGLEGHSPATLDAYRGRLDRQVLPALGQVRLREISVGVVDRFLAAVKAQSGPSVAKMTKSVLSGILSLALRHDAIDSNPTRGVSPISNKPKRPPRSLSVEEVRTLRKWLSDDPKAQRRDLSDLVAFMAGSGCRIGEACALQWTDVDLDGGTVSIVGTVSRVKGQGLVISRTKTTAGERVLELPSWCVEMLQRRPKTDGPVFPAPLSGKLRDPANTRRGLREAFAEMGQGGLSSHNLRKTVATLMSDAGLSPRQAADQLGHAQVSMTLDRYMGRNVRATGAAIILEQLAVE